MDEKLAMRKVVESANVGVYSKNNTIHVKKSELDESRNIVSGAIKEYYDSIERTGPFEFQVKVDSNEEMWVHTVRHVGKIAEDCVGLASSVLGVISSASTTPVTGLAGAVVAVSFMESAAIAGISLAYEIAETITDIAKYKSQGCIISTVSLSSDPGGYIVWCALEE